MQQYGLLTQLPSSLQVVPDSQEDIQIDLEDERDDEARPQPVSGNASPLRQMKVQPHHTVFLYADEGD